MAHNYNSPTWLEAPPLRQLTNPELGKVLLDIENHMPQEHIYRDDDRITWGHETTHGINARLRKQQVALTKNYRLNCFYVLGNRAAVIEEPNTTLEAVAKAVPIAWRGRSYHLYLIKQQRYWNKVPLYIFDEWVAYTNGSKVRIDLNISSRGETVGQMLEFSGYALTLAYVSKCQDPQFLNFLIWQYNRAMATYILSSNLMQKEDEAYATLRFSTEAYHILDYARTKLGLVI